MPPEENKNPDQFKQVVDRLKEATNILVTVSANPSVDQLAACIGLTIALNKKNKHASAVFSGHVPSTIEFLEPEKTLEKDTNSLRDFIISLDKAKADKLRYKVEDSVVRIFITPYKTSISEDDLEFSQGDFNVDAVVALGVVDRNDLDQAIVAHGRILHDATVISVNTANGTDIGAINWQNGQASSLCEMVSDLVKSLGKDLLDAQIATALLTGVVAETDRFRNEKSSPHTMAVSGILMEAGASTQLVAAKLEEPEEPSDEIPDVVEGAEEEDMSYGDPGLIEIDHDDDIHIDESGNIHSVDDIISQQASAGDNQLDSRQYLGGPPVQEGGDEEGNVQPGVQPRMVMEPPQLGGQLTGNSIPESEQYSGSTDPLSAPNTHGPTLNRVEPPAPLVQPPAPAPQATYVPPDPEPPDTEFKFDEAPQTLEDIERSVNSPHLVTPEEITPPSSQPQVIAPDNGANNSAPPPPVPPPLPPSGV